MTLQRTSQVIAKEPERRVLSRSSRSMGILLLAGRGTGKSGMLGRKIAMQDFLAGFPQVIFDPVGATIDNFLDKVTWFLYDHPQLKRDPIWDRIIYVDMSAKDGVVVPFPLYYRTGTERSLLEIAERYLQTIIKSNPALFQAQVLGWPPLHRIGVYSGMVLSALGYQITEAEELLDNPEAWEAAGLFAKGEQVSPEAKRAVAYFRNKYIPMREADRARLTTPFLDKIFTFPLDETLRAMFGAAKPGINWDDVVQRKQTVLLDFRREQDEEMRRFKMLWTFSYLYEWIKARGRPDDNPFGVIIDEFAHMTQQVVSGKNPLAQELDEFINVFMHQHTIWFTAAHQELYQIDEQLQNTMLSLGTYILGGTSSMESARELADALYFRDPYWVKDAEPIYGRRYQHSRLEVIDVKLHYMPLEEQTELFAQRIRKLGRFQFLLRPALAEGHIGDAVLPLSISDLDRDKETGEYQFPDLPLVARLRTALAKQSGIPIARLLQEQEKRIPPSLPETTWRLVPPQPRQPSRQRTAAVQTRQPLPRPDGHRAQQHAQLKPMPQEDRQPPVESPSDGQKPAALRRRHRLA
jgi:hypothetical protein